MRKLMFKLGALASGVLLAVTGVAATSVASVTTVSGGNNAISRYDVDHQANFSILDGNNAIDQTGVLTSWQFYAQGSAGGPVMLKIYRLSGGVYTVVGTSTAVIPVADSLNTQAVNPPILVKAGDFVGFQVTSLGVVPYDKGATEYAPDLTHIALFTDVGSNATAGNTETFTGSGDRTYSINVSGTTMELSATPASEYVPVGTTHSVVAYIGTAVQGVTVHFDITGPNAGQSGTAVTDATGHATFTYTGSTTPGTDTITTWIDQDMSGALNAGDPSVTVYKYWFAQYTSFGGNAGSVVKGKAALTWAFDGFAGYVPGAPGTGAFGSVTVNYRTLNTSCTFTPGATGTFGISDNPTMFPGVHNNVATLTGWTNSCGGTATIQVLAPSVNTSTPINWSRGAVFVWYTTPNGAYNVNVGNPSTGPGFGWAPLVTGMTHVVSP